MQAAQPLFEVMQCMSSKCHLCQLPLARSCKVWAGLDTGHICSVRLLPLQRWWMSPGRHIGRALLEGCLSEQQLAMLADATQV